MKSITKIFFILGVAFWSIGLLYSFSKLIALNGLKHTKKLEIDLGYIQTTQQSKMKEGKKGADNYTWKEL